MKVMDDPVEVVKELSGRVVEYQDPVVDAYDWEEYFPVIDPVTRVFIGVVKEDSKGYLEAKIQEDGSITIDSRMGDCMVRACDAVNAGIICRKAAHALMDIKGSNPFAVASPGGN